MRRIKLQSIGGDFLTDHSPYPTIEPNHDLPYTLMMDSGKGCRPRGLFVSNKRRTSMDLQGTVKLATTWNRDR
ncbi:hypothetical protein E1B28_010885 [Marasmius oreades]|uniref:Uncharacterized protein n=1 Tax=Marasmius oreades TaxID=181124 RepID=A0A9P7RTL6_9AGAR|nr:uncharacterized protein E1B28_010885 [Marasmius oreades]KAG7089183.1 hypothetical protein E1B28_010885 [Marasmius oreades]